MLTTLDNFAVVQMCQLGVFAFFVLIVIAVVSARWHLPKTKVEPLIDVLMVAVLLVYAVVLRIYFST